MFGAIQMCTPKAAPTRPRTLIGCKTMTLQTALIDSQSVVQCPGAINFYSILANRLHQIIERLLAQIILTKKKKKR
jgi:hypothetical protein